MSNHVSSAIIDEIVSRATFFLTDKLITYISVDETIDRLEMLCLKIRSAVEVSEGFDINIKPLQEWQEKLKEALFVAEETLDNFKAETLICEKRNQTIEGGSSSHDQSMQEKGNDNATLALAFFRNIIVELVHRPHQIRWWIPVSALYARVLKGRTMLGKRLENDEKVSKLEKTVEKLEKMAGDIGDFIELLKLQWRRNMCRKRKRSARPRRCQVFFLVVSLKLQSYGLFCYEEDPHLLVIKLIESAVLGLVLGFDY